MTLHILPISLATALFFGSAAAQAPVWKGPLQIEPGNDSGKCFTANSNANGAPVTIQTCTGADSQKWTFSGGSVKVFGSKCLDIVDGKNTNGNKLQIWDCSNNGNKNQQFYYTPWGDNHLAWTDHGKCIDLTDGKLDDGNRPQIWDCSGSNPNQVWNVGYNVNSLPATSEDGQFGTNNCGTGSDQNSKCQTLWINALDDFCLWGPPNPNSNVGDTEEIHVGYCTKSGRGARTFPAGTFSGVHFVKTKDYVQITGKGDFTKIGIRKGDSGGELDPHGATQKGNPIGGLLFGNSFGANKQYHEWTQFTSDGEFCIRACTGPNARENCQHIYDVMGCYWNMPANYDAGTFESCQGDNDLPMGVYGTSTWHQGTSPTPPPHPQAKSSQCSTMPTISVTPAKKKRSNGGMENVVARATPAPQL